MKLETLRDLPGKGSVARLATDHTGNLRQEQCRPGEDTS
jgi:hypothetical protein